MGYIINLISTDKKTNSTAAPSGGNTINNARLEPGRSTIINPVFRFNITNQQGNPVDLGSLDRFNYMTWSGNLYWIDNIKSITNDVVEITATRDPLGTFRTAIRSSTCDIVRCNNSSYYDLRQYDNMCSATTEIQNKYHNSVSSGLSETNTMSVMGFNSQDMEFYASRFSPQAIAAQAMASNNDVLDMLEKNMGRGNEFFNMAKVFPFRQGNIDVYPDSPCYIGTYYTNCKGGKLIDIHNFSGTDTVADMSRKRTIDCGVITCANITTSYTDFRRYDKNYTQIVLIVPFVGQVEVDPIYLNYATLEGHYYVDLITGKAEFVLRAVSSGYYKDIGIYSCQMGVDVPISVYNTNWFQITNDIYNGNPIGAVAESQLNPPTDKYTLATTSGFATRSITEIYIDAKTFKTIDKDYAIENGIPTNKRAQLSSVGGFVQCLNPSLSITGATKEEIDMINNTLKGGMYIE